MKIKVIETTDNKFEGFVLNMPSIGDSIVFGDYKWTVVGIEKKDDRWIIWDYNYVVYCEEIEETNGI